MTAPRKGEVDTGGRRGTEFMDETQSQQGQIRRATLHVSACVSLCVGVCVPVYIYVRQDMKTYTLNLNSPALCIMPCKFATQPLGKLTCLTTDGHSGGDSAGREGLGSQVQTQALVGFKKL